MSQLRHIALILALTALSACSVAQPAAEHIQHYAKENINKATTPQEAMVAMDGKMKATREMHEGMSMMEKMDAMGSNRVRQNITR